MNALAQALLDQLDDDALDALADRLSPRLEKRLGQRAHARTHAHDGGWLNTRQAAEYLSCPVSRIYDLVQLGELQPRRDGRRLLFKREDLDAYLERSA